MPPGQPPIKTRVREGLRAPARDELTPPLWEGSGPSAGGGAIVAPAGEAGLACAAAGKPPKDAKDGRLMITVGWPFRCSGTAHSADLLHLLRGSQPPLPPTCYLGQREGT
jgi:hypothetical protein